MQKLTPTEVKSELQFATTDPELKEAIDALQPGEGLKIMDTEWLNKSPLVRYINKHFIKNGVPLEIENINGGHLIVKISPGDGDALARANAMAPAVTP